MIYERGLMKFKINPEAKFHYNEDGTLTVTNIAVVPVGDNFNYDGGIRPTYEQHIKKHFKNLESWFLELPGNKINSIVTDSSNIGHKVSINYINDVENIGSNNLH